MISELEKSMPPCPWPREKNPSDLASADETPDHMPKELLFLVAPLSATFLDRYVVEPSSPADVSAESPASDQLQLDQLWSYKRHINLDDLDFASDGLVATLRRVVGRRGLGFWAVKRAGCN